MQVSRDMIREENDLRDKDLNILVLSDTYGKKTRKKYNVFLEKYYPNGKIRNGLSKIIYYKNGELKYVSTWEDGDNVLEEKIKPFVEENL